MKLVSIMLAMLVACAAACGHDPASPLRATPANVIGSWGEDPTAVGLGYVFIMALSDTGNIISGTGSYSDTTGFGPLGVSGTAEGDSVHLQVVYHFENNALLPPDTARVDGAFATRDRIEALRVRGAGPAQAITLIRLNVVGTIIHSISSTRPAGFVPQRVP
jgi:hypothetical protein